MFDNKINKLLVNKEITIIDALKIMDNNYTKLLIVIENEKLISVLSIGDIQRAILKNFKLDTTIDKILRKDINICYDNELYDEIKDKMFRLRTECMPIINNKNDLITVYFWDDVFTDLEIDKEAEKIDVPVVIMAGGKGSRLKPLTNVIPKPLIPVGDKPIMEQIINNFNKIGCNNFFATINYKADMIEYYFNSINKNYSIDYAHEKEFLGTAGSLHLLRDKLKETFFVSNCDILINEDYREIYKNHINSYNDITIVVAIKNFSIPYGTIELDLNGLFKSLKEKPELSYMINTGMYVLNHDILKEINDNEFLHITTLIEKCSQKGKKIGIFPISEGSWLDMGQWNEYHKTLDEYEKIKGK